MQKSKQPKCEWLSYRSKTPTTSGDEYNPIADAIMTIPKAMNNIIDDFNQRFEWPSAKSDIRRVQDVLIKLKRSAHSRELKSISVKSTFTDDDYRELVDSWIFLFIEKRWDLFNINIREAMDILNNINIDNLPKETSKQFTRVFNQLFNEKINCTQ